MNLQYINVNDCRDIKMKDMSCLLHVKHIAPYDNEDDEIDKYSWRDDVKYGDSDEDSAWEDSDFDEHEHFYRDYDPWALPY